MSKSKRIKSIAKRIAYRKIFRYILARNLLFAVRWNFDPDDIEIALADRFDQWLYIEQQNSLHGSFSIHSRTFKKFCLIRYEGGNYIDYLPFIKKLEQTVLRDKRSNSAFPFNPETQKRRSYGVGKYSMMYIFNEKMMQMICNLFERSKEYDPKLDLGSSYYSEVIGQLKADFPDMKFSDMNKPEFRLKGLP